MTRVGPRISEVPDPATAPLTLPTPCSVSVALIDARKQSGRLPRFVASAPDILLESEHPRADGEKRSGLRLRAEQVSYIGVLRSPDINVSKPANLEPYKVHVAGGERIAVETAASLSGSVGFLAFPTAAESPYQLVFFYHHGVNARERDAPLGALLVSSGVLGRSALEEGISAQKSARNVPIGQILVEQKRVDKESVDEAVELQKRKRLRIGDVLKEAGLVSDQDIEHALAEQKKRRGKRLGEVLVELGVLRERDLSATLAHKFDLPFVNLDEVAVNPAAFAVVGRELVTRFGILPLDVDAKSLTIAISDPTSLDAIDVLRVHAQRRIREVMAMPTQLKQHVEANLTRNQLSEQQKSAVTMGAIIQGIKEEAGAELDEDDDKEVVTPKDTEAGVVQLVNQIIVDAYRQGVSDIHIEPNGKSRNVLVRFRLDGDCKVYQELPPIVRNALVSCIK
ncbi:MAG TPA: hypothetical protein VJR89_08310, partial [Polyangiales bacterium]|nr:hypothetical protein [Polyangiales bacterium]